MQCKTNYKWLDRLIENNLLPNKVDNVSITGMHRDYFVGKFGKLIKILAVVPAILAKLVIILRVGLMNMSKTITSIYF